MKRSREYYDKAAVGRRISDQRKQLKISRQQMAEYIGKTEKYYSDIERGYCGMSLETMIDIAGVLGTTLDYITFGDDREQDISKETKSIMFYLDNCSEKRRKKAVELLQVYLSE